MAKSCIFKSPLAISNSRGILEYLWYPLWLEAISTLAPVQRVPEARA